MCFLAEMLGVFVSYLLTLQVETFNEQLAVENCDG